MARKLTAKQESYKNQRIKGFGPSDAYRRSTYTSDNMTPHEIATEAGKLDNHPVISLLIAEGIETAQSTAILTREEALKILTENARECEEPRDQHQAIKQVSTMQGWDAAKKFENTGVIGVASVSANEYKEARRKMLEEDDC